MLNEVKQTFKDWGCFVSLVQFTSRERVYLFLLGFNSEIIIAVIMIFYLVGNVQIFHQDVQRHFKFELF